MRRYRDGVVARTFAQLVLVRPILANFKVTHVEICLSKLEDRFAVFGEAHEQFTELSGHRDIGYGVKVQFCVDLKPRFEAHFSLVRV